jgi:hypothetical protein
VEVTPTPTITSTPTVAEVDSLYWESEITTPIPEIKNNDEPIRQVPRLPMVGLKTFQRNVRNSKRRNF